MKHTNSARILVAGAVFAAAFVTANQAAAAAPSGGRNIDCTQGRGVSNCLPFQRVTNGPLVGMFVITGTGGDDVIRGSREPDGDLIRANAGNDLIVGEAGADVLVGGAGNDRLDGSGGNDVLRGDAGNDVLGADAGRDRLLGGVGNDTYVVPRGSHSIADSAGTDRLRFPRANRADASFRRIGPDLVIDFPGGEVRIQNHAGVGRIEAFSFEGPKRATNNGQNESGNSNAEREDRGFGGPGSSNPGGSNGSDGNGGNGSGGGGGLSPDQNPGGDQDGDGVSNDRDPDDSISI